MAFSTRSRTTISLMFTKRYWVLQTVYVKRNDALLAVGHRLMSFLTFFGLHDVPYSFSLSITGQVLKFSAGGSGWFYFIGPKESGHAGEKVAGQFRRRPRARLGGPGLGAVGAGGVAFSLTRARSHAVGGLWSSPRPAAKGPIRQPPG